MSSTLSRAAAEFLGDVLSGRIVRSLFWTYPDGMPGAGLLLMRLSISGALISQLLTEWRAQPAAVSEAVRIGEGLSAVCLLAGLGTPFWAAAATAAELWRIHVGSETVLLHILLGATGVSLALLGPGSASVDAWIFGWRQVDVGDKRRDEDH